MTRRQEQFHFRPEEPSAVLARMDLLARAQDGWLNLAPRLVDDDTEGRPVARHTLASVLGSPPPPAVPLCTWMPRAAGGSRGSSRSSLGILHNRGRRAVQLLAGAGIELPDGWRTEQDHQRRGLVLAVPQSAEHAEILGWTCRAASWLCGGDQTGSWLVTVYSPQLAP
jgi:hypothetical protein